MGSRRERSTAEALGHRARRRTPRDRERGAVAVLVALMLVMFFGFVALTVDWGRAFESRAEMQNALDAAALAAAGSLDGTAAGIAAAEAAALAWGLQNRFEGSGLAIDPSHIEFGTYTLSTRTFVPDPDPTTNARLINAVRIDRRPIARRATISHYFAPVIGTPTGRIGGLATAVGGGPSRGCGFPVAIPDCTAFNSSNQPRCGETFTIQFANDIQDSGGWTILEPSPPVSSSRIRARINDPECNSVETGQVGDTIYLQNGNIASAQKDIADLLDANGGQYTTLFPVIGTGNAGGACSGVKYNQSHPLVGFVTVTITGVDTPGNGHGQRKEPGLPPWRFAMAPSLPDALLDSWRSEARPEVASDVPLFVWPTPGEGDRPLYAMAGPGGGGGGNGGNGGGGGGGATGSLTIRIECGQAREEPAGGIPAGTSGIPFLVE